MTAAADDAQSFIGSFLSITANSEIRYEGYLCYINAEETTIGLRNVKSLGTEGRRMDGPQIPPDNCVFQYIFFQGSDIKALEVLSAPDVNMTADMPEDPAIIRGHYPHLSNASMNMVSATTVPQLPNPTFEGSLPLSQSVGSSQSSPTGNDWPGFVGSSEQVPHLQQQSFPPPPQAPSVSPPGKPATMASHISPNHMPYIAPSAIHYCSSVLPSLASSANENAVGPLVTGNPEPVIGPTLLCQTNSQSVQSVVGSSSVFVSDEDGNTDEDATQSSGSGLLSSDSENSQGPGY